MQKYAVVDANHVSAPLGATWGNVGRFPGAFGGHGRAEIGDFELQSAMRKKPRKPNAPMCVKHASYGAPTPLQANPEPRALSLHAPV